MVTRIPNWGIQYCAIRIFSSWSQSKYSSWSVHSTGKHHLLPHKQTKAIAFLIERIGFVSTATPHTNLSQSVGIIKQIHYSESSSQSAYHVHVGCLGTTQQVRELGSCDSGRERISGNPIGSFHKHGHAVDFEVERATGNSACIGLLLDQFNSSNADFVLNRCLRIRSHDFDTQRVQMRVAVSIRPPQDRILDRCSTP